MTTTISHRFLRVAIALIPANPKREYSPSVSFLPHSHSYQQNPTQIHYIPITATNITTSHEKNVAQTNHQPLSRASSVFNQNICHDKSRPQEPPRFLHLSNEPATHSSLAIKRAATPTTVHNPPIYLEPSKKNRRDPHLSTSQSRKPTHIRPVFKLFFSLPASIYTERYDDFGSLISTAGRGYLAPIPSHHLALHNSQPTSKSNDVSIQHSNPAY